MSIYEKNIEALKQYMAKMYDRIEEDITNFDKEKETSYEVLEARNGSLYSQYVSDGKCVRFNSNYNPEREAAGWIKQYTFDDFKSTIVMFGIAGGYFAKELLGIINESSNIILVEPEKEIFYKSLHYYDMTDLIKSERVSIAIGKTSENLLSTFLGAYVYWTNVYSLKVVVHPGYEDVFAEEYNLFYEEVRHYSDMIVVERNTEEYFGKEIAYNTVSNIEYVTDSNFLSDFVGVFPEDTVGIVVAAGPSLDNNISVLHQMKGKAVILATDTALRSLHKEGIVPDFVISIDPRKPIYLFENAGFEEIPFLCRIDSNPEALHLHKGHKIWSSSSVFFDQLYERIKRPVDNLSTGGSVATAAFSALISVGIKNVVLIGQDLAYKGDITHVGGEVSGIMNEEKSICYVKGNNGEMVKTRGDWLMFLKWYERAIRDLPEGITVINATEGGAYIEGTTVMTLQEVCDKYCENDLNIDNIIKGVLDNGHSEYNADIIQFFEECVRDLGSMVRSIEKAVTLCGRFERKYSKTRKLSPEVSKCISDISKINKRIGNMPVYWLIDEMVKHEDIDSIKNIYNTEGDEYTDNINMIKNTKHIFELTLAAAKELRPEFEKAVAAMHAD
ncbi:MAG: motility associated factor glycosyltransferase family protein [Lachnospiraceae bacterium]|nr:motility associated factor glycosyltransferase family protein [Lachnospiraceae bacterium]